MRKDLVGWNDIDEAKPHRGDCCLVIAANDSESSAQAAIWFLKGDQMIVNAENTNDRRVAIEDGFYRFDEKARSWAILHNVKYWKLNTDSQENGVTRKIIFIKDMF